MKKIKKKRILKKILLLIILLLGILLFVNKKTNNKVYDEITKIVPSKIKGTIINKTSNTITIMTDKDVIYYFDGTTEYNTGDDITVTYTGNLNIEKEKQDINIRNINKTDIYLNYDNKLLNTVDNMSTEEKVGQLLLARVPNIKKLESINTYHIGGYLLFKRDIENKTTESLKEYINNFQTMSKIPLIIAVDEEGGTVSRLSTNKNITPTPYKSPQELFLEGGYDAITNDTINKNNQLKELGFNFNLAPVADICTNEDSYIYARSFGKGKDETSTFVEIVVKNQTKEVSNTLKHFPGYSNNEDTHTGISKDNRTYQELKDNDFYPFISGTKSGAKGILVSHNIMTKIDSNPASLSIPIHNMIREDINFKGIIFTDDLSMEAISEYEEKPYTRAVLAGNNMLIVTDFEDAYLEILESVNNGTISKELLDRLVLRVLQVKEDKEMI